MNFKFRLVLIFLFAFTAIALSGCAGGSQGPDLVIEEAWVRQSPMAEGNGAVYMILINNGNEDDALIGASTDASNVVELHETTMENDVMRMRPVEGQRIVIPAKGQVELKPAGLHVMLIDLKDALKPGSTLKLALSFEKSGDRTLTVEVRAMEGLNMDMNESEMETTQ
ncbi:MAG: copper chaperone PCu(A)C [Chloroflexi bacterium]|nr:copper chaperone PCu(A)C [Chloroflexota bacterium]